MAVKLVADTIENDDIDALADWLKTYPRLTKGDLTVQFEEEWSKWLGCDYSIFVNSGSSANLLMLYAMKLLGELKNNKIVVPAVSWATTLSPVIQLGMEPILCECDKDTLGIDVEYFEKVCKMCRPAAVIVVHVLGFPCKMKEIVEICDKYGVKLLEDACESAASSVNGVKTGNFGQASSFSTYFAHFFSTTEGGIVSTNDYAVYNQIKMLRSHGWERDLSLEMCDALRKAYNIDEFRALYTFYTPGFNLRPTDIQAFLGLRQLKKLDFFVEKRKRNYTLYNQLIKNDYWKPNPVGEFSNFAYPIITPRLSNLVDKLGENNIECRPLICGSMGRQPFYVDLYGEQRFDFADKVHDYGLYLPNNHQITKEEIEFVCGVVNCVVNG